MDGGRKRKRKYTVYLSGAAGVLLLIVSFYHMKVRDTKTDRQEAVNQTEEAANRFNHTEDITKKEETGNSDNTAEDSKEVLAAGKLKAAAAPKPKASPKPTEDESSKPAEIEEETLGNPRSSFGLGSASYLKGKNILVSIFVDTPDSSWEETEKEAVLEKIAVAAAYIEDRAEQYQVEASLLYDWTQYKDLKKKAKTDFSIREDTDFIDRLDEEISLWFETKINYEELLEKYRAQGIATLVFVNNPGISYAIVYDGTDNIKESIILFSRDYYNPGRLETATVYAHEILHVFGAHDLYEEAEFTDEVADYVRKTYPNEIMYSVTENGQGAYNSTINHILSPITAYHLGWIDEAEEISEFPQLSRE